MIRPISSLDAAREANPDLGFSLYALEPGRDVTLEIMDPAGEIFTFTADSEAAVFLKAFPPEPELRENPVIETADASASIFD